MYIEIGHVKLPRIEKDCAQCRKADKSRS